MTKTKGISTLKSLTIKKFESESGNTPQIIISPLSKKYNFKNQTLVID